MRLPALSLLLLCTPLFAATPEQEVRQVLDVQITAWNRGDLAGFVAFYSPDSVFVGKNLSRGNAEILERYKKGFPTQEKMGTLNFTDVEVRLLGSEYASIIGRFHLVRTAAGGGNADGIFNLVFRKTADGWKIILDHTS